LIYLSLFFVALISATLFPMGSEALLIYDITQGYNIYLLLLFASLGNILGSLINYILGLKGEEYLEKKGYLKKEKIEKYNKYFKKYGAITLLFSWLPIVGDPITFVAGVLKYNWKYFLVLVSIAKFSRYLFLALAVNYNL